MMRQLVVFALGRIPGIKVTETQNGAEAYRKLSAEQFDLIVTDINMPIMDGLKLIKRIREDERHRKVPILIITTESQSKDKERALALGASAYITKPIQAPQIVSTVKKLLKID